MAKKIYTEEEIAAHKAAKAKLLNAGRSTILDHDGNPITVEESDGQPKYVNLSSVPIEEQYDIINTVLVKWLWENDVIDEERNLLVSPEEMARRGQWLYTHGNYTSPVGFQWDGDTVIHFIY